LFVTGGINGNAPFKVENEKRLTSNPGVAVYDGYFLEGYQCVWFTLVELRPTGPVNRGVIYVHADNKGTGEDDVYVRDGKIVNVKPDRSFDVIVPGKGIRDHYEMIGTRFVGPKDTDLKC
jgi:hypothetical protein